MINKISCLKCGTLCEYDDKPVWEGNRDFEEVKCPKCREVLDEIFTDQIPVVRIIEEDK